MGRFLPTPGFELIQSALSLIHGYLSTGGSSVMYQKYLISGALELNQFTHKSDCFWISFFVVPSTLEPYIPTGNVFSPTPVPDPQYPFAGVYAVPSSQGFYSLIISSLNLD